MEFEKSLAIFIKNINAAETDSLIMRYISNFVDKIYNKYRNLDKKYIVNTVKDHEGKIQNDRKLQLYRLIEYYISDMDPWYLPSIINPPVFYVIPNEIENEPLAIRNIHICDITFA